MWDPRWPLGSKLVCECCTGHQCLLPFIKSAAVFKTVNLGKLSLALLCHRVGVPEYLWPPWQPAISPKCLRVKHIIKDHVLNLVFFVSGQLWTEGGLHYHQFFIKDKSLCGCLLVLPCKIKSYLISLSQATNRPIWISESLGFLFLGIWWWS